MSMEVSHRLHLLIDSIRNECNVDFKAAMNGIPIYIATNRIQRRKHHKNRINKKWQKRYGFIELNYMPHGQVVMMDNGVVWMTRRTFNELKEKKWID